MKKLWHKDYKPWLDMSSFPIRLRLNSQKMNIIYKMLTHGTNHGVPYVNSLILWSKIIQNIKL